MNQRERNTYHLRRNVTRSSRVPAHVSASERHDQIRTHINLQTQNPEM